MTTIFITYTLLVILAVAALYFAYKYTVEKKVLKWREWGLIACGVVGITIMTAFVEVGFKVNNKLKTEFKVPKDFYSNYDVVGDSTLDDATLYNHLLLMRVSHPKVMFCQAKIESANYTSDLFKRNSNMFGMKKSTNRVTTAGDGRGEYKWYPNWRESVTDYAFWQLTHNADKMTQDEYIKFLGKIYAEDPKYTSKVRELIKKIDFEKLEQYEN